MYNAETAMPLRHDIGDGANIINNKRFDWKVRQQMVRLRISTVRVKGHLGKLAPKTLDKQDISMEGASVKPPLCAE